MRGEETETVSLRRSTVEGELTEEAKEEREQREKGRRLDVLYDFVLFFTSVALESAVQNIRGINKQIKLRHPF